MNLSTGLKPMRLYTFWAGMLSFAVKSSAYGIPLLKKYFLFRFDSRTQGFAACVLGLEV